MATGFSFTLTIIDRSTFTLGTAAAKRCLMSSGRGIARSQWIEGMNTFIDKARSAVFRDGEIVITLARIRAWQREQPRN
jgi:hypothetical protein